MSTLVPLKRIHGPIELKLSTHEVVVLCLVKNGEHLIDDFIRHYQSLGFSHICLLDNGSSDATVQRACAYSNVTVLQCTEDYKHKKTAMKWALMDLFGKGRWHLTVDIDEFFQYPFMDSVPLGEFIRYLNEHQYTSVVAHMLDMVPPSSLMQLRESPIEAIGESDWYFNFSTVVAVPYEVQGNVPSNPEITLWYGGIRKALFGVDIVFLTKHCLNFGDGKIVMPSSHIIRNRHVADVSGLLLHYKFVGDVYTSIREAVDRGHYYHGSYEYKYYLDAFDTRSHETMLLPDSHCYESHRQLLSCGLFTVSDMYRATFS